MRSRIFFAAIAAFWVVMNVLLWRSQSDLHSGIGNSLPIEVVWEKMLTAPDSSMLEVFDHGNRIGYCHWAASEGDATEALRHTLTEDYAPDGLIPQPSGYSLNVDGHVEILRTNNFRFDMRLLLSTNRAWQDFSLAAKLRNGSLELHAIAASQKIMIKVSDPGGGRWQKTLAFSQLLHPDSILGDFGGLGALRLAGSGLLPAQLDALDQAAAGLKWEAHEDWHYFGHARVRVYRLESHFLGEPIRIFVSRAGEILSVEAPGRLTLRNEAIIQF